MRCNDGVSRYRCGCKSNLEMAEAVAREIRSLSPVLIVAGMPLDHNGQPGLQAKRVESLITRLRELLDVEIVTQDERFSTAEANRVARDMNARGKKRKGKVDQIAATLILQTRLPAEYDAIVRHCEEQNYGYKRIVSFRRGDIPVPRIAKIVSGT